MVKIVIKKKINFTGYTMIEGFSGVGLVGTLASQYLVNNLDFIRVGYVYDEELPPVAVLNKGEILHPIRIYACKKSKIMLLTSELPMGINLSKKIASEISEWAKKNKIKQIISLEGMASLKKQSKPSVYYVTNSNVLAKKVESFGGIKLMDGFILGVSGELILECIDDNVPILSLMAESYTNIPDGFAAAELLTYVSNLVGIKINTKPLVSEAEIFERKIKDIISQFSKLKQAKQQDKSKYMMYG